MKLVLTCLALVAANAHADAPIKVLIDKTKQRIHVTSPETAGEPNGKSVRKVSTGGGWKKPVDPKTGQPDTPYCADDETPNVTGLVIQAIPNVTMFEYKESNRFTSADGAGVPMPFAIHVVGHGGIYLHQVPAGYEDKLGQNVSGGCIRLDPEMAVFLFRSMEAYGSIELTISGTSKPRCTGTPPSLKKVEAPVPNEPIPHEGAIPSDWVLEGPVKPERRGPFNFLRGG